MNRLAVSLASATLVTLTTHAAQLVGLSSTFPGNVYSIDPNTGAATLLTTLKDSSLSPIIGASFTGLEALNGDLYATDIYPDYFSFGKIDLNTGVFTAINNQDGSANWHALAADQGAGLFYTVDINDSYQLKSVTPSGVVTTIGGNQEIRGLAFDDVNDILYGYNNTSLYTLNVVTGASTLIGNSGVATYYAGLAYDVASATLFLNDGSSGNLYTLNTATGAATLVGANGAAYIDGLAVLPSVSVPEAGSTVAMLSLVLVGLGGLRRRGASAV